MSGEANYSCFIMYLELFQLPLAYVCQIFSLTIKSCSGRLENLRKISVISTYLKFFLMLLETKELKKMKRWVFFVFFFSFIFPVIITFILASNATKNLIHLTFNGNVVNKIGFVFYFPLQLRYCTGLHFMCVLHLFSLLQVPFCFDENPASH